MIVPLIAWACAWEYGWWFQRKIRRHVVYDRALALARRLNRPLVVIGAPDRGPTRGAGYGDLTIDIGESDAPNFLQADITQRLPIADDSVVVYVSCVLEYVSDRRAAWRELLRIAGDRSRIFDVWVEPWTIAHNISGNPR